MRLTNTIRDAYVRAVMQDVPKIDHTEAIRKLVTDDLVCQLPKDVKVVWENPKLCGYLETSYAYFGASRVSVTYPCDSNDGGRYNRIKPELTEKAQKAFDKLDADHAEQAKTLKELERKAYGAAYACSTRKQLAELIPEFEKYLPEDDPAAIRTLPVVANIMSDFVKAGWPKGGKKK